MSKTKTNAIRILECNEIEYTLYTYDNKDGDLDGLSVAEKLGEDKKLIFKTLVTRGQGQNVYIFVIPIEKELDLKKAAKASGEKRIEMLPLSDLQKWTGYVRGGCSPVGMKKLYPTYIDAQAKNTPEIIVSAGKIGFQMKVCVSDLLAVTKAQIEEVAV